MITISGTFTNPSGVPLPLLTIMVNSVQSVPGPIGVPQDATQTYSTNSSGAYSFTLDTGVYNIYVSGNGITQGVLLGQAVVNDSSIDTDLITLIGTSGVPTNTIMAAIVTASQDAATTVEIGTTTTVAAGTPASVTNVGTITALVLDFNIPQGESGGGGGGGSTTVEVGTTTTGAPGTDAAVSNSGTDTAVVLDFTIPAGKPGIDGTDGTAATISVGITATGAAGSSAEVSNAGTSLAAILNFTIPQGEPGSEGPSGLSSSVADGTYFNASVTVSGSTITAISSGSSSGGVTEGDLTDGSISPEFNAVTATSVTVAGLEIEAFPGFSASWINLPTTGPSGIGSGGPGTNPFVAYVYETGNWFGNANPGDVAYRNTDGNILFGTNSNAWTMAIVGNNMLLSGPTTENAGVPTLGQTESLFLSSQLSVSIGTTVGSVTIPASELIVKYSVLTATQTADFTVTTDTASNILGALPNAVVGTSFVFRLLNNDQSSTGYAATLAAGTGVTISTSLPNHAVAKGAWGDFLFTFTDVTSGSAALTVTYIGGGTI